VPTFRRPDELRKTVQALAHGALAPNRILVSEGDASSRPETEAALDQLGIGELLPPPPGHNRSGNRNWLVRHVDTEFALFVDDDVSVHPEFLARALAVLDRDPETVAVSPGTTTAPGAVWLTFRGHFRAAGPDEPCCPSFMTSLWRTEVLSRYPLDERIRYGYEDADMAFRMAADGVCNVRAISEISVDRGAGSTVGLDGDERQMAADIARVFVAVRRHNHSRTALLHFLAAETAANIGRWRRPLPRAQVPGQWQDVARWLTIGHR
jgi:GT2 family glycosyltransferase